MENLAMTVVNDSSSTGVSDKVHLTNYPALAKGIRLELSRRDLRTRLNVSYGKVQKKRNKDLCTSQGK